MYHSHNTISTESSKQAMATKMASSKCTNSFDVHVPSIISYDSSSKRGLRISTSPTTSSSARPSTLEEPLLLVDQATPRLQRFGSSISDDVWKPKEKSSDGNASSSGGRSGHVSVKSHDSSTSPRAVHKTPNASLPGKKKLINSTNTDLKPNAKLINSDQSVTSQSVSALNPATLEEVTIICGNDDQHHIQADDNVTEATIDSTTNGDEINCQVQSAHNVHALVKEIQNLKERNNCLREARKQEKEATKIEISGLKKELRACYKKNISMSKKSKDDAVLIERLMQNLDERDMQITALHAAALKQNNN